MRKDEKHFGQRLREARLNAGLSQSELEERSGIPKARLSRYENGHVVPSIQTLERLAIALGVSEASLLGDQRAILEGFFNVLHDRGVRIHTLEQGARLANALADLVQSVGAPGEVEIEPEDGPAITASPLSAVSWGDEGSIVGSSRGPEPDYLGLGE